MGDSLTLDAREVFIFRNTFWIYSPKHIFAELRVDRSLYLVIFVVFSLNIQHILSILFECGVVCYSSNAICIASY